jgi:ABC-type transport system involved in multi-copper enzyme maturation permease subunit
VSGPLPARGAQLLAVARLEARRQLFSWRAPGLILLAALPVLALLGAGFLLPRVGAAVELPDMRRTLAGLYQTVFVHFVLFFGCLALFGPLVRSEVERKTLHFWLLVPLPRGWVLVGKYLTALVLAWALFLTSALLSVVVAYLPFGLHRLLATGVRELTGYGLMTLVGCVAYGAAFTALGTLLRRSALPVALFFFWELFHYLLPPVARQLSILHYLKELHPLPVAEGPFAILTDPAPAWVAVAELLVLAAALVGAAAWRLERMELDYGGR